MAAISAAILDLATAPVHTMLGSFPRPLAPVKGYAKLGRQAVSYWLRVMVADACDQIP